MLPFFISILGILLTIFLIVTIHELGHFIFARLLGVKVLRFSIGFGKPFYNWCDKKGTEYALAPIPLGGYVKLLDENEGEVAATELHRAYNRQPLYKRFLIVIAGPLFNLLLAAILYWLVFIIGFTTIAPIIGKVSPHSIADQAGMKPQQEILSINNTPVLTWMNIIVKILSQAGDNGTLHVTVKDTKIHTLNLNLSQWHLDDLRPEPLTSLGFAPYEVSIPPIVDTIQPTSDAANKLKKGDRIISVANQKVKQWDELAKIIYENPDKTLPFLIERNDQKIHLLITIGSQRDIVFHKYGRLGIIPQFTWPADLLRSQKFGAIEALSPAWNECYQLVRLNILMVGKLIAGKISIKSLGGPITIFEGAGTALNHGLIPFMSFLAFLSIAIGVMNVLPIPGLDGGHLLMQALELIMRRPLSLRVQALMYRLGIIFLLVLVVQAVTNDFLRM